MKFKSTPILLVLALSLFTLRVQAQPDFEDDVEDTPIDKHVVVLMAIASIFAVNSLTQFHPKTKDKKDEIGS
ncbi:MAG: hypothetical protein K9H61_07035 [Bacteroidia bacterium]|nr:hypothetical protein [Bacteroidia bacterium]MCF8427519.1 hypothetical protein [Bacteroidia bacterium]MCF8446733.1 hypothetical protein [Bacteroidia bacterium]